MDIKYENKQLITVEYPGTVINMDKFLKSMGGESEMFLAFKDSSKRLELKFRPDDPYCKSAHGDRFNTTNLLLKIIKRTRKQKHSDTSKVVDQNITYKIEFLGVASTSYKFKAMADFQIPPITYDETKQQYKSLIPDLMPTTLHPSSWLDKDVDLFIPPLLFSRFDLPQSGYADMHDKILRKPVTQEPPPNTIGQTRHRRAGFAVFTAFESTNPCDTPQPEAILQLKNYPLEYEIKKKLDELFQEKPIWTRNGLVSRIKIERGRLKHALPCSAYYFTSGPWRSSWVRFGFDPRREPSSKGMQIMDLRINANIPINEQKVIKRRSTYYSLPNKIAAQNQQRVATINTEFLHPTNKDEINDDDDEENYRLLTYQYIPGQLPLNRQCFYQLGDIHLDSVQELIHQNDGHEEFCHEKDGWCIPGTIEKCRELILADIVKTSKLIKLEE